MDEAEIVNADDMTPSIVLVLSSGATLSVLPEEDGTETYALLMAGEELVVLGTGMTIREVRTFINNHA